jgi:hypothetical protein
MAYVTVPPPALLGARENLIAEAAHVALVQVRATENAAVPEIQDERILACHGSPD